MTPEQARDIIFGVLVAAWNPAYPVLWDDITGSVPNADTPWARAIVRHTFGRQTSLSGEVGARKFTSSGVLFVQVFAPVGQGSTLAYQTAELVANAYRDAKLEVWFRNTRINEVGASGAFEQINVVSDFSYDNVR